MTRTEYYRDTRTGLALYAQPIGDRTSSVAAGSAVSGDGTLYQFAGLDDDTVYEIFEQAGASPADNDEALAIIGELGAKESTLGTPNGSSLAYDIAEVEQYVAQIDNAVANVQGTLGTPDGDDLAADVAELLAAVNAGTMDAATLAAQLSVLLKTTVLRQAAGLTVTELQAVRGTTWAVAIPITLAGGWTRIAFTARRESSDDQEESALHVIASNPADGAVDGLRILAGDDDTTPADGSIDTSGENPVLQLAASAAAELPVRRLCFDAKVWTASGVTQEARGTLEVLADVSRSTT